MTDSVRLYLDVDGVICPYFAPEPAWGPAQRTDITVDYGGGMIATYPIVWAPALIVELDRIRAEHNVELVWLTSWNQVDAARQLLVPALGGLKGGRMLDLTPGKLAPGEAKGWWKAQRILEDQIARPGPFIWIDDIEVELHGPRVLNATRNTQRLLLPTSLATGINVEDIQRIDHWLEQIPPEAVPNSSKARSSEVGPPSEKGQSSNVFSQ